MSGPKVVRIVTRDELQAIGRGHLEKAAVAIQELEKAAQRHGKDVTALSAELSKRHEALQALYREDRWLDLQRQAGSLAEFAQSETKRHRSEAVSEAKVLRLKYARARDAAQSLIATFQASGRQPTKDLLQLADGSGSMGDGSGNLANIQSILNAAFRDLNPTPTSSALTQEQRELAAQLGAGEKTETFADWLDGNSANFETPQDTRIQSLLAELDAHQDLESVRLFMERLHAAARVESESQRSLLTDSIVLDLSNQCKRIRQSELLTSELGVISADLKAIGSPSARAMAVRISKQLESLDVEPAQALLSQAKTVLETERRAFASTARRRVVLEGLASLGYEVRETMDAAWVKDGRIVVGRPGTSDYGVEIGATPDADKMQVRLVGSDRPMAPRDRQRDIDMETLWCSEFQKLKANLSAGGTDLIIEKALGVGVQPVKTVPFADESIDRDVKKDQTLARKRESL